MTTKTSKILLLLISIFLGCRKSKPNLTEDEVYTIINEIIADDSLWMRKVCCNFTFIKLTDEYKKEFTQDDIAFINLQNESFKNLKIKPNKLKYFSTAARLMNL